MLDVGCERKRRDKDDSKVFGLSKRKAVIINREIICMFLD